MGMEGILQIITGVARVLALMGGLLAAVFVAWSGIQWITSSGDPQKIAQARTSLIGALAGLVVVGIAFLIPEVVSELVIEPAGGVAVRGEHGFDCDGLLRRQLVIQRGASNPWKMQGVVSHIQSTREECSVALWNPTVNKEPHVPAAGGRDRCYDGLGSTHVGDVEIPAGLVLGTSPRLHSFRDSANNILVYWTADVSDREGGRQLPSDGGVCWMYLDTVNSWVSGLLVPLP